jgi:hypothetical protein
MKNQFAFLRVLGVFLRRRKDSNTIENWSLSICHLLFETRRHDALKALRPVVEIRRLPMTNDKFSMTNSQFSSTKACRFNSPA